MRFTRPWCMAAVSSARSLDEAGSRSRGSGIPPPLPRLGPCERESVPTASLMSGNSRAAPEGRRSKERFGGAAGGPGSDRWGVPLNVAALVPVRVRESGGAGGVEARHLLRRQGPPDRPEVLAERLL